MKASEARLKASTINKSSDDENYNAIIEVISKAANGGAFECEVADLRPKVLSVLEKELGYTITHRQSGINEYCYLITW